MIHLQVKARSGLHAGATWRLDQSFISLGAHQRADIFLCDPDIPENLITFRKGNRRYEIEGINPEARLTSLDQKKVDRIIFPSQVLVLDYKHVQIELQVINAAYGFATSFRDSVGRTTYKIIDFLRNIGARAILGLIFLMSMLLTATVLFFGTAGVVKSEASMSKKLPVVEPEPKSIEDRMTQSVAMELNDFAAQINSSQIEVREGKQSVEVSAVLSRSQAIQFERTLNRLARDYGEKVSIKAALEFTESQQLVDQIDIAQIVLGSRPVVVLRDGRRLYVGGVYQGISLLSIESDKVVFQGDTRYEVAL